MSEVILEGDFILTPVLIEGDIVIGEKGKKGDPGQDGSDANVTNENVNAAIATDPAASRAALDVLQAGKITGYKTWSSAGYVIEPDDGGKMIAYTGVGVSDFFITTIADGAPPVLSEIVVVQAGAGQVAINDETGVTLIGDPKTGGQDQAVYLVHQEENTWRVIGGVE
jgi:hypothetical protein